MSKKVVFGQCPANHAWYVSVERQLATFGMPLHRVTRGPKVSWLHKQKIYSTGMTCGWSPSYRNLLPEYERWYPNDGPRRLPRDLNLGSPVLLANWYMGNGTCYQGAARPEIALHTEAYPEEDIVWAREELERRTGVHGHVSHSSRKKGRRPILGFGRAASSIFLELVRPHVCIPPFRRKMPREEIPRA